MDKQIEHKGKVLLVDGDRIDVEIVAESACATCHAKQACGMGDQKEKILQLLTQSAKFYEPGEDVMVVMEQRMGIKAAFYAYMLPFFIVIAVLFAMFGVGQSDLVSGLSALGSLVVYYIVLAFFRKRIEKDIVFKLRKIDTE